MNGKSICLALILGGLILLAPADGLRAAAPDEIGIVRFASDALDGAIRASGDVVLSGALIRTELKQAIVHLTNGQVLKLEPNSSARFESVSFDEVEVTVYSGLVVKWSAKGRALTAGTGSRFRVGRTIQDPLAAEDALMRHDSSKRSERERNRGLSR